MSQFRPEHEVHSVEINLDVLYRQCPCSTEVSGTFTIDFSCVRILFLEPVPVTDEASGKISLGRCSSPTRDI